jgi:hypothetical protein
MNPAKTPPLAELHLHLYGCLPAEALLAQLSRLQPHVDLTYYERSYEEAYGTPTPIRDILQRHDQGDPAALEHFHKLFVFGEEDAGNFARFQAKFDLINAGSAFACGDRLSAALGRNAQALMAEELCDVTTTLCQAQLRQGLRYAEQRMLLTSPEHWPWCYAAMRRGMLTEADGFTMRIAASLPRHDPWPCWGRVSALALGPGGETLTGVDFCYIEEGHPPKDKAAFFAAVKDHNQRNPRRPLAILYHVGESFTDKSLESAVRWVQEAAELGANRLGHAIALGIEPLAFLRPGVHGTHTDGELTVHKRSESAAERMDQLRYDLVHAEGLAAFGVVIDRPAAAAELFRLSRGNPTDAVAHVYDRARLETLRRRQDYAMAQLQKTGAVIEVCPTSNRRIGGIAEAQHHPVHRFLAAGLRVVVASDDPGIFGTTLTQELAWVKRHARLSDEAQQQLLWNAWNYRSEVLTGRQSPAVANGK